MEARMKAFNDRNLQILMNKKKEELDKFAVEEKRR
jgi:hypothetical protein